MTPKKIIMITTESLHNGANKYSSVCRILEAWIRRDKIISIHQNFTRTNQRSQVKVDNKNSYKWFGLSQSTKWRAIKKLKEAKLIEVKGSMGRAPRIKIIAPKEIKLALPCKIVCTP